MSDNITPQNQKNDVTVDLAKVLESKQIKAPRWAIRLLERLLHLKQINLVLEKYGHLTGVDFAKAVLEELRIKVIVHGMEHIPLEGNPIIASNHPLGGPDGMALIGTFGERRSDILFPVNDFLMSIKQLQPVFVPIDKVHGNRSKAAGLEEAFAGNNALLFFPAGLCSRRIKGKIQDTDWKPTFVKKAILYQRDIVPVFVAARNRKRFYFLANVRKKLGIRFNFEMALLPAEMFAQQGKQFHVYVGSPISWKTFDFTLSPSQWATRLHDFVYQLPRGDSFSLNV